MHNRILAPGVDTGGAGYDHGLAGYKIHRYDQDRVPDGIGEVVSSRRPLVHLPPGRAARHAQQVHSRPLPDGIVSPRGLPCCPAGSRSAYSSMGPLAAGRARSENLREEWQKKILMTIGQTVPVRHLLTVIGQPS